MRGGLVVGAVERARHGSVKRVVDQRGLAGTGYAGQEVDRLRRNVFQCHVDLPVSAAQQTLRYTTFVDPP